MSVTRTIEAESLSDLEKESLYILTGKLFNNFSPLALDIKVKNPDPDNIKDWEKFAIKQNLELFAYMRAQDIATSNLKYERSKALPYA